MDNSEEDHENEGQVALMGFLFGNIDESGQLEDDIFDEESKRHLAGLNALGIGSLVKELTEEAEDELSEESESQDVTLKSEAAIDYSDINEAADEEEESEIDDKDALDSSAISEATEEDSSFTESSDSKLMPPPSWIPSTSAAQDGSSVSGSESIDEADKVEETSSDEDHLTSMRNKLNTPLATMLPPELADRNVTEWFPEFRAGQVLRFSRLFKPQYHHKLWKRQKKKKAEVAENNNDKIEKESVKNQPLAISTNGADNLESIAQNEAEMKQNIVAVNGISDDNISHVESGSAPEEGERDEEGEIDEGVEWINCPFTLNMGRSPKPEELAVDDRILMTHMADDGGESAQYGDGCREQKPAVAEWRYGPAQLWYDMLGVNETGEGFDYGFKLKQDSSEAEAANEEKSSSNGNAELGEVVEQLPERGKIEYPEDAFLMVAQIAWEEDIIWCGDDVRQKILQSHKQRSASAGWLPSMHARTVQQFQQLMASNPQLGASGSSTTSGYKQDGLVPNKPLKLGEEIGENGEIFYSLFPVENDSLLYDHWEKNIIWDAQAMDRIPEPIILALDPNDENLILEIPEDREPVSADRQEQASKKEKESKKSKFIFGKSGTNKEEEEQEQEEEPNAIQNKDPFNLSNDEYYNPKLTTDTALGRGLGGLIIQHSTPAVELRVPFFPTHLGPMKLRNFHRPPLKKYSHGNMTLPGPQPVLPLLKHIKRKERMREQERQASGGGEMFFMRTADDLSGKDGELILAEYSEEFPPLLNQVGMATKIKNYYKRKPGKDINPPQFKYGELAYAHTSPMLGTLNPGQCLPAFENNMFRAPIYQHNMPGTDFLIIRNRMHFYVREVDAMFVVGQECPLIEVPGPNSKRANNFIRDFLQVFIYRLFWKSKDFPRRIKMEEIRKAFPTHSESSIRKRLKMCADFKRTGTDSNWWVLKSDFRLPTEEEMRAMVSPEQCCAYYSMLAAEQRLKDAGYGEKSLFAPEDDNEEETQTKIEDEVRAAPWNTTRAYIAAMKGRCLLQLTGVADPTGCGEGFSYVKVPNKPNQQKDEQTTHTPVKRTVTGTDADLRRLPLKDAKNLLRKFGVAESDIKKLSRWQVINVVREMSTEQARAAAAADGGEEGDVSKFARGNRFSVAEHLDRYKKECNDIFNLQNRVLSSEDILSTDDDSSEAEDSDFEEMGKNLENLLSNKKTSSQISMEREEAERLELQRMIRGESLSQDKKNKKKDANDQTSNLSTGIRKLKITRTFHAEDGSEYTRTEIVSKPNVIDIYVRIRETKEPGFIRQFASTLDDNTKEEMKKERRRIQEQLRRIKRNEVREKIRAPYAENSRFDFDLEPTSPPAKKLKQESEDISPSKLLKQSKLRCGACGQKGHMRTNKECPMSSKLGPLGMAGSVALSEEQEEELEKSNLIDSDLINVEGTKVTISKQLVEHAEQVKRKSLLLKFPKMAPEPQQPVVLKKKLQRRATSTVHCDYLKKPNKPSNRLRADPIVTISSIFESILNEMRELPNVQLFLFPVNPKQVPDYNNIISNPMDLQTIRQNIQGRKYLSREAFLVDVNQIVKNCELYNGPKHALTVASQKMLDFCLQRIAEKEEKLMRLEKKINPLLDDDDFVSFSFILTKIINEKMKTVDQSHPFHTPVNKKFVKDYYEYISTPMDISTIQKNVESHQYTSREQFVRDVDLMVSNCERYNGYDSVLANTARRIQEACMEGLKEDEEQLDQLEANILIAQQAAADAVDTDSVITGTSIAGDLESVDNKSFTRADDGTLQNEDEDEDDLHIQDEDINTANQGAKMRRVNVGVEDSLEQDLKMSPENSDEEGEASAGRQGSSKAGRALNLSGSESESEEDGQAKISMFSDLVQFGAMSDQTGVTFSYDENAQDFAVYVMSADAVTDIGDDEAMRQAAAEFASANDDDYEDGNFDPQAFFSSIGTGQAHLNVEGGVPGGENHNIHTDLQVSDSDDDDKSNDNNEDDDGDFVAVDDNDDSSQNFDMKEFLK